MFSFRKIATPALAALFLVSLPAWSALADEPASDSSAKPTAAAQPKKRVGKLLRFGRRGGHPTC